jgi:hypothetical protein
MANDPCPYCNARGPIELVPACTHAGLTWAAAPASPSIWDAPSAVTRRPSQRVIVRASLAMTLVYVLWFAGSLATAAGVMSLPLSDIAEDASVALIVWRFVFAVPLASLLAMSAYVAVRERLIPKVLAPTIVERRGDVLRARIASAWRRRSDARLSTAEIRGVYVQPDWIGTMGVWVLLDLGHAFQVAELVRAHRARCIATELDHVVRSDAPTRSPSLPHMRTVEGHAETPDL